MQEDIENRAVALAIKSAKLTGHGLKVAIAKYLAHRGRSKSCTRLPRAVRRLNS